MALARVRSSVKVNGNSNPCVINVQFTPTPPAIGNAVVMHVSMYSPTNAPPNTITDNYGNVYQLAKYKNGLPISNVNAVAIYYCPKITATGSAPVFTITMNMTGGQWYTAGATEISGVGSGLAFVTSVDSFSSAIGAGTATTGPTAPLVDAEVLQVAVISFNASQGSVIVGAATPPWTQEWEQLDASNHGGEADVRVVTNAAGTTPSASWSTSHTTNWQTVLAVFRVAPDAPKTKWRVKFTGTVDPDGWVGLSKLIMASVSNGPDLATGGTPSASSEYGVNYVAAKAFDSDPVTYWSSGDAATAQPFPQWLEYKFATPVNIIEYRIQVDEGAWYAPTGWTFEYWDGAGWVVVDTRSGVTDWTEGETRAFRIQNMPGIVASLWWDVWGTPPAFDSTGAKLIVVGISTYEQVTSPISDNFGNTWIALPAGQHAVGWAQLFYTFPAVTGPGHIVTVTPSTGLPSGGRFGLVALSVPGLKFDASQVYSSVANGLVHSFAQYAPPATGAILFSVMSNYDAAMPKMLGPVPLVTLDDVDGYFQHMALGFGGGSVSAPITPTWTLSSSFGLAASLAAFRRPAAGSYIPWWAYDGPTLNDFAAVAPSNTVNLRWPTEALYVGTGGDVSVTDSDGTIVTLAGVPSGSLIAVRCVRVNVAGTTASNMVALRVV